MKSISIYAHSKTSNEDAVIDGFVGCLAHEKNGELENASDYTNIKCVEIDGIRYIPEKSMSLR